MYTLIGFGNPLLDICLNIQNNELLIKYDLQPDDQKQITKDEMTCLVNDIKKKGFDLSYSPGGCAQNTVRLYQSLQNQVNNTCIVGAVGFDEQGERLKRLVEENGVVIKYTQIINEPTGTTVALISGSKRSLVAYLGAAECLTAENMNYNLSDLISNGKVFYMEGFFLTKRIQLASTILDEVTRQNKIFVFNISARYICEGEYHSIVQNIAKKCKIVIGNLLEFESLKVANDFKADLRYYLKYLSEGDNTSKIVIVTNGASPILWLSDGKFTEYPVSSLDQKLVKDTTGAGDAFVAGFLYAYLKGQSVEMCVEFGCVVSREVIQNMGCFIPKNKCDEILQKYAFEFKSKE